MVKVAVRVRPYNEREIKGNSQCCVTMVSIKLFKPLKILIYKTHPKNSLILTNK